MEKDSSLDRVGKKINNRKFKTFAYGNVMIYRQLTNGNLIKMSKSPTNFIKL